jgi:prolyl-tRNA editing enzyme YbaK/EbsC (Cys-tRNA(Pro) deacylase)
MHIILAVVYSDGRAGYMSMRKSSESPPKSLEVYDLINFSKNKLFKAVSIKCKKKRLILIRVKLREKLDTKS